MDNKVLIAIFTGAILMAGCTVFVENGYAQENDRELPQFRAHLYSGKMIEGSKGLLTSSTLTGIDKQGQAIQVPTTEITSLEAVSGSKADTGALLGAGVGLLTGLSAILQVSLDDQYELDEGAAVAITGGLTVGFALIGAVIGSSIKEWESVRLRPDLSLHVREGSKLCLLVISF